MRYKREIELVFDLASLQKQQQARKHSSITLRYVAPSQCPPEKEFFLRHISERLHTAASTVTRPSRLLGMVSAAWDKAGAVAEHVRRLNLSFPTAVETTSGGGVRVTASVLLVPLQTRVEAVLNLAPVVDGDEGGATDVDVVVTPAVRVVYGEQFNAAKMTELLAGRIGGSVLGVDTDGKDGGKLAWDEAVLELYKRLLVKGKQR